MAGQTETIISAILRDIETGALRPLTTASDKRAACPSESALVRLPCGVWSRFCKLPAGRINVLAGRTISCRVCVSVFVSASASASASVCVCVC